MTWNHDITAAPRGKTVTVTRTVKGEDRQFEESQVSEVWLATKCGRVIRSYWLGQTKFSPARWAGLATTGQPIAWQDYVVPVHPNIQASGETGMVLGTGRERPLSIGLHTDGDPEARFESVSLHQVSILDDCGSGA